ncbi:MAG: sigma-54-dependent Fis family transcriptional regulator [Deltaproteobacteria bacterium]|nr:sigma-54-dependent Fis family transcriptional regulator [Deltaproteobacteria bacterium]
MARLLIIDDDENVCQVLLKLTTGMNQEAAVANTLKDGLRLAENNNFDLILLDLELPDGNGLKALPRLLRAPSLPEVIIITGTGGVKGAELAFKHGAWHYVQKPFSWDEVSLPITRALQYRMEKTAKKAVALDRAGIIGESEALRRCLDDVARIAATDTSVVITGETGTGKELFARAIHLNSARSSRNFIAVDCGALPENLAESMLFGHEKGAFTGADKANEGLMRQADGGTLFLDEIGDLPPNIQKAFLRTLQERRLRPLGGKKEVPLDFRLVSATNRDLDARVKEGLFREDLLFRIRGVEIKLPPLRERMQDLHEIMIRKIHDICQRYSMGTKGMSPEFLETLASHRWPGNVRELIHVLEYAAASAHGDPTLFPIHLPPEYRSAQFRKEHKRETMDDAEPLEMKREQSELPSLGAYRDRFERTYLLTLLDRTKGDRDLACRLSGISQSRLYGLLKKHNLARFSTL